MRRIRQRNGEFVMSGIIIAVIAAVVGLCALFATKTPDGPIEEAAEYMMEGELGLPDNSIDLSPGSKED